MVEMSWNAQLSAPELVMLMGLLEIHPGESSILFEWLSGMGWESRDTQDAGGAVESLVEKGLLSAGKEGYAVDSRLNLVLQLAAEAGTDVVVHLRRGDHLWLAYFAQAGDMIFQYLFDGKTVVLYPARPASELVRRILPDRIQVLKHESFSEVFSYPAFLILLESSWKFFEDAGVNDSGVGFTIEELMVSFKRSMENEGSLAWLGIDAYKDTQKLPVHSIIQDFIERGLFRAGPEGRLKLGEKAIPFLRVIADPGLYTAVCSITNQGEEDARVVSWYAGGGSLMQVELRGEGMVEVRQLFNTGVAQEQLEVIIQLFAGMKAPSAQARRAYWDQQLADRGKLSVPPESTKVQKSGVRRSRISGLLIGLAGSLLSALLIGFLSTIVLGFIRGQLSLKDFNAQLLSLSWPSEGSAVITGSAQGEAASETGTGSEVAPAATAGPDGPELEQVLQALEVEESRLVANRYGSWSAVGTIRNTGTMDIRSAEVKVVIGDGSSVILEELGSTRVPIRAGEASPFDAYLWGLETLPENAELQLEIVDAAVMPEDSILDLQLANVYTTQSGWDGEDLLVLGEIVNSHDQPVFVWLHSLLRDNTGLIAATLDGWSYQQVLLPGERVPFSMRFIPSVGVFDPSSPAVELFTNAIANPEFTGEPAVSLSQNQFAYIDEGGDFHIVGQVLNEETGPRSVSLIAAVYDAEGRVVDVCDHYIVPDNLPSQAIAAYDLRCWNRMMRLNEDGRLRSLVHNFDIMVDRRISLRESDAAAQRGEIGDVTVNVYGTSIEIFGELPPMEGDFDVMSVVVYARDTATNMLIGAAPMELGPAETEFAAYIQADPATFNPDTLEISVERYCY